MYLWAQRREKRRGMNWFYVLALVYKIDLTDLNFTPSKECLDIKFFSKGDLLKEKDNISSNILPLVDIFNPEDFK